MAWYKIMMDYGNQATLKHPSYIEYVQFKNDIEAQNYASEIANDKCYRGYRVVYGFQKVKYPPKKYIEKKIQGLKEKIIDAKTQKDKWEDLLKKK